MAGGAEPMDLDDSSEQRSRFDGKPHVGIIGAGIAGLRCADVLLQRGFQVTIIEGRDRVGGRMHQMEMPNTNYLIDLGPNWIHGTVDNPILDLAKETQTVMHSWGEKTNLFDENGRLVSSDKAEELTSCLWGIILDAFKYSNENSASIPINLSLHDWFVERVKESIPKTVKDFEQSRKMVLQMSEMWGAFVGCPITRQSLKFFWMEECIEGENLFCAGTYQKILQSIARPAVVSGLIKFSTKAVKISSSQEGNVTVTTDKDELLHFDELVVTTPLGWLKQNRDAFSPPLPDRLCHAIDSIGYGCLEKVFITFPEAFWLQPPSKFSDSVHLSNGVKSQWLSNDSTSISSNPAYIKSQSLPNSNPAPETDAHESLSGFTNFLSPTYSSLNPSHWAQEAIELSTLPSSTSHPTLLFYIFGPQSHSFSSHLSTLPETHSALTTFFEPYYSRLPNYTSTNPACIPVSSHFTNWLADDLAGNGSYSDFQVGGEELDEDVKVLREGLPQKRLWFAGEHTAPFVALGTVTGAYWSGEGVAVRLARAYGLNGVVADSVVRGNDTSMDGVETVPKQDQEQEQEQDVSVRAFVDVGLER